MELMTHGGEVFNEIVNHVQDAAADLYGRKCFAPVIDIACRREFLCFVFRGICSTDEIVQQRITRYVLPLAKAYLEMYNSALEIREFFGLRDFYR